MATMVRQTPAGDTNVAASLRAAIRKLKRRGLVVVISDLIDEPAETLKAMRLLAGHRQVGGGFRDWPPERPGFLDPREDRVRNVPRGFLARLAVGHAAGQVRNCGKKSSTLLLRKRFDKDRIFASHVCVLPTASTSLTNFRI